MVSSKSRTMRSGVSLRVANVFLAVVGSALLLGSAQASSSEPRTGSATQLPLTSQAQESSPPRGPAGVTRRGSLTAALRATPSSGAAWSFDRGITHARAAQHKYKLSLIFAVLPLAIAVRLAFACGWMRRYGHRVSQRLSALGRLSRAPPRVAACA